MKNGSNQPSVSEIIIKKQSANASVAICQLSNTMILDAVSITEAIEEQEILLKNGDLTSLENMLLSQTHVLNLIFTQMVSKMGKTEYMDKMEVYGRLALKAQNQTRQTIAALGEIKGIKKTTFIHQVNKAHNQQVNNGVSENLNDSANERSLADVDGRSTASGTGEILPDKAVSLSERDKNTGGQQRSAMNSLKHGMRSAKMRELERQLAQLNRQEREAQKLVDENY
jgi:hypothetical protein